MTTIAFKDGIMACESCQSHTYIDQVECKKIFVVNGDVLGLAGALVDFPRFITWYKEERVNMSNVTPPQHHIESIEALVYSKGKLYHFDEDCIAIPMGSIAGIGSGGGYAVAAMLAGADAGEAVKIACKLDMYSNGTVYHIDCNANAKKPRKYSGPKRETQKKTVKRKKV